MKHCPQCGTELEDNAKFCTACGSSVVKAEDGASSSADTAAAELKGDASTSGASVESAASEAEVSVEPDTVEADSADGLARADAATGEATNLATAEAITTTPDSNAVATPIDATATSVTVTATKESSSAQSTNFKAAMDSSKRKSKRKIPMVVLVAIITMLTAGVAFAAYYVYTEVIVPQQEQAAQEAAEQERIEAKQSAIAQAEENYASLLDEYRKIQEDYAGNVSQMLDDMEGDDFSSQYPVLTSLSSLTPGAGVYGLQDILPYYDEVDGGFKLQYAFEDLNNDGIYELVVATTELGENGSSAQPRLPEDGTDYYISSTILGVYAFSDGKLCELGSQAYRGSVFLTEDNYLLVSGSSGAYFGGTQLYAWDGSKMEEVESWSVGVGSEDTGLGEERTIIYTKDGKTESQTVTIEELEDVRNPILESHPKKTDFEWREF